MDVGALLAVERCGRDVTRRRAEVVELGKWAGPVNMWRCALRLVDPVMTDALMVASEILSQLRVTCLSHDQNITCHGKLYLF